MPLSIRLRFDPERENDELRRYLGDAYDHGYLERYQSTLDEEVATFGNEDDFYRNSRAYLYDLTAFAMTGTKLPYLELLRARIEPGSRILDYGCGIGSDGLMLLEAGYQVEFADFDNPSTAYLRWRLEQRSLPAKVHNLDVGVPGGFDAAYAFDVIEHVRDPFAFLAAMEARAALIEVNFLEFEQNEQELHYPLPINALLHYVSARKLLAYRLLHGSSHVVVYRPATVGGWERKLNAARVWTDGVRRRARSVTAGLKSV